MILLLENMGEVLCSQRLCEASGVLSHMKLFTKEDGEPIPMPEFASKNTIDLIMYMLEGGDNKFDLFVNLEIHFLMDTARVSDFLDIHEVTDNLLSVIKEKVTYSNCFCIFTLVSSSFCFHVIAKHCLNLMMIKINNFYVNNAYSENDPYKHFYIVLYLYEIRMLLTCAQDTTIVTKILIFRHWWNQNKRSQSRYEVLKFLEMLNQDSCYKPRHHIIYFRSIRDQIIAELDQLQVQSQ